jgi:UPF0755 protein
MSRGGYEGWDNQPDAQESGRHNAREGRRARRAAAPEDSWPGGSRAGQGSGEWPESQAGGGSSWQPGGYDPAGYTEPAGYADPGGYADRRGYQDSGGYANPGGYPDSGGYTSPGGYQGSGGHAAPGGGRYPGAGSHAGPDSYPGLDPDNRRYYESGGRSSRALPAGGSGDNGYPESSYPQSRYSGSGGHGAYAESGYQGGGGQSYGDNGYRDTGYPDSGYSDNGYGDQGYGGQGYSDRGYRDASYPGAGYQSNGYPGGEADPYAGPDSYRTDPGRHTDPGGRTDPGRRTDPGSRLAGRGEQDYGIAGGYGAPDGYGRDDQYGGDGTYGAPGGYRTSDAYPVLEAYSESGAGRGAAGYDAAAGYEHGGGYDDDEYGSAAGAGELDGPGGRGAQDDSYDWQAQVDDTGIGRRGRRSEDEIDADSARHNQFFRGFGGGDDDYGHRPKKRRRSRAPIVALFVVIVFLAAVAGGGVYAYKWYSKRHADWVGSKGFGSVTVQVKPGEIACSTALENTMVSAGVVASATAFCDAAKTAANSAALEPGYFRLHKHMGAALAWDLLTNPKSRVQQTVAVPDGLRATKIIQLLAKGTGIPLSQFQAALKDTSALGLPSWAHGNPEGFLYPATYDIQPETSALDILKMMVTQFNTEISSMNLAAAARRAQFTEYQIITEASLLEGEVGPTYYADVARVIDNRLNQVPPMDLGLDSTVAYATGQYIYNLSAKDLSVNNPYNTFNHAGLPPGPIDSPDVAAIQAVLRPNDSATARTWLYFVTVNKAGLTKFTASPSQFQIYSNEAKQNGV